MSFSCRCKSHVCFEAQDLACIQLGEGNATSFSHRMLYFTSSGLACFPVSSCRSRQWDILEQSAVARTQASASSTASQVCSPRLAGPWQPGAPGHCLLPSLQAGPLQHGGAKQEGWPAGCCSPSELLSVGLWMGCSRACGSSSQQSALGTQTQSCRDLWVEEGKSASSCW